MITLGISSPVLSRAASTSCWFIALLTSIPAKPASRTSWKRSSTLSFLAVALPSVVFMNAFFSRRLGLVGAAVVAAGADAVSAADAARGARAASAADDFRKLRRFMREEAGPLGTPGIYERE